MIVRKYVVNDMHEGMNRIRQDMGREAIILSQRTRCARGVFWWKKKERLEIYAAADEADIRTHVQSAAFASVPVQSVIPCSETQIKALQPVEADLPNENCSKKSDDLAAEWLEKLLDEDVHYQVARTLLKEAIKIDETNRSSFQQQLNQLITNKISQRIHQGVPLRKQHKARIMVAGPSGYGKTTSVIKLAGQLIREHGLSVGFISADFLRAGAHLQLKAYAKILDAPVVCLQSLAEAKAALIQLSYCDLILIDTPGCNLASDDQRTMTQQMIQLFRPDQIFVCISACTGYRTAGTVLNGYREFCDFSLIITRMDEIKTRGSLLNIASLTDRTIAYLTDSPAVSCPPGRPDAAAIASALIS